MLSGAANESLWIGSYLAKELWCLGGSLSAQLAWSMVCIEWLLPAVDYAVCNYTDDLQGLDSELDGLGVLGFPRTAPVG